MAKHIHTSIEIHAPAAKIWNVLINFEKYQEWNPFIVAATGTIELGAQLQISIQPPHSKAMRFKPIVKTLLHEEKLAWLGTLGMKGLFDGHHIFKITPQADGTSLFIQEEYFSGILVPFLNLINTQLGFEQMNRALKSYVENLPF